MTWSKSKKVVELRAECERRGVATDGLKAALVARLEEDDKGATGASGETRKEPLLYGDFSLNTANVLTARECELGRGGIGPHC